MGFLKERKLKKKQQHFEDNPWIDDKKVSSFSFHRKKEETKLETRRPEPHGLIPRWFMECTLGGYGRRTGVADVVITLKKG